MYSNCLSTCKLDSPKNEKKNLYYSTEAAILIMETLLWYLNEVANIFKFNWYRFTLANRRDRQLSSLTHVRGYDLCLQDFVAVCQLTLLCHTCAVTSKLKNQ